MRDAAFGSVQGHARVRVAFMIIKTKDAVRERAPVDLRPATCFFPATRSAQDVDVRPLQEATKIRELI